jgi:hypothetical protein
MKAILIFILGFVVWAWVGFQILEWMSMRLLAEAWDNSYEQFQEAYPWSAAQMALDKKFQEQKQILVQHIKDSLKENFLNEITFGVFNKQFAPLPDKF